MRKLATFAIPFAAAVFAAVYLLSDRFWAPAVMLCALGLLLGLFLVGDRRLRTVLICAGLAAGFLWTGLYGRIFYAPAQHLDGQTRKTTATVMDWAKPTTYGIYIPVRLHAEHGPDIKTTLFSTTQYPDLKPGDSITFTAQFHLSGTARDGQTDYYRAKGIFLTGNILGKLSIIPQVHIPAGYYPVMVSKAIKESVAACFDPNAASLITALLTGDKSGLDGAVYAAFQRTGIAHVVAVSGMHVSFLAGFITTLLGRNKKRSALAAILILFFFAAMAGNTPSVLRAALLQGFLLLAPLLGREDDKATSLSTALLLLLIANPYSAASVSLQLSFAAVTGIYLLTGTLYDRWKACLPHKPKKFSVRLGCKAARFVMGTLATTIGAMVFTTPLLVCYFNTLSFISPLANLLMLWAVSYAFLGGLIVALVGIALPVAGGALAFVAALPTNYILWLAPLLSKIPFAAVPMSSVYLQLWLALVYVVALLYVCQRGEMRRPIVPVCACSITLCIAMLLSTLQLAAGDVTVTVLDVGQGQSVALTSAGRTVLVDCGGSGLANPGDVAANFIQSQGSSKLDLLVLTHYHADHAGGVAELLKRLDVGLLILPDVEPEAPLRLEIAALAAAQGVPVEYLTENADVVFGLATLRIYAPLGDGGANEEGLSVLCKRGDFTALITGDMNAAVERRLLKYGEIPELSLFIASHHGSKYATSLELLAATRPQYAAISVGENTYGQPAPETLERLAQAGCAVYRTDLMGTVTIMAGTS